MDTRVWKRRKPNVAYCIGYTYTHSPIKLTDVKYIFESIIESSCLRDVRTRIRNSHIFRIFPSFASRHSALAVVFFTCAINTVACFAFHTTTHATRRASHSYVDSLEINNSCHDSRARGKRKNRLKQHVLKNALGTCRLGRNRWQNKFHTQSASNGPLRHGMPNEEKRARCFSMHSLDSRQNYKNSELEKIPTTDGCASTASHFKNQSFELCATKRTWTRNAQTYILEQINNKVFWGRKKTQRERKNIIKNVLNPFLFQCVIWSLIKR